MKLVLLTNFIPPSNLELFRILQKHFPEMEFWLSTPMEKDRKWEKNWEGLKVKTQFSLSLSRKRKSTEGFEFSTYLHLPIFSFFALVWTGPKVVISSELGFRSLSSILYRVIFRKSRLILWLALSEHTEKGIGKWQSRIRKWMLRNADAIFVNGSSGMKYLKALNSDTKFYITPYSPPLKSLLHVDEIEDSPEFKLLIPGQLIERKGIINFLQSLYLFIDKRKPDFLLKLRVVGSGPLETELHKYSNSSNFSLEHIQFIPYEEMPLQYQWADVVVFSSFYDEWGLVVNEALAAARPVLGSIYGQASIELVEHGKNGILYDPLDAESVDKAMSMLFSLNKMQLAQMGALGRKKVMEISPDIVASTMQRGIGTLIA